MNKPIFSGTLFVLPVGWKQVLKKTWQEKYCVLYKASKSGIERLEIYENQDQDTVPRIITLENCIKIEQKSNTSFSVITKSSIHDFMGTNEESFTQWITMIQHVAFKDFNTKDETASICEDNELYCPSDEKTKFEVSLHSTDASNRCKLEGKVSYVLVLTSNAIQLFEHNERILLFTWPYCYVRRYGYKDGKFTFEAGRKCESGEGMFLFEHDNQQEIFRCVSAKMKNMKKMLKESMSNNNNSSNTTIDLTIEPLHCGENQLQAAMTMGAGSRSPLPPSPTTSTTLQDVDSINLKNMTPSSSNKDEQPISSSTETVIITKDIPKKPPRKNIWNNNVDGRNSPLNYETIEMKYDEVEKRENAWQTLGTVDVKHLDYVNDCVNLEESEIEYLQSRSNRTKQTLNTIEKTTNNSNSKVIYAREIPSDDNVYNTYDHLSFFGSTSKLCSTPSNGYKQVIPVQSANNLTNTAATSKDPINSNDYDEVGVSTVNIDNSMNTVGVGPSQPMGEVSLEGIRLADDSHLGYAVVRKPPTPKKRGTTILEHKLYNDNPYAIISKPKHV